MFITINSRKFYWTITDTHGLSLTYSCDETELEYVMITDGSTRWSAYELYDRIKAYSEMPLNELRALARDVL